MHGVFWCLTLGVILGHLPGAVIIVRFDPVLGFEVLDVILSLYLSFGNCYIS